MRRGGKRLRPALLAAAARACGRATDAAVIDAGCAWELLQAYFLVHDDWMDGDATRRGGPSVHVMLAARHRDDHLGASLAVLAYLFGSYADEQRSRREGRKLRRLRDEKSDRPRMPLPSSP